MTDDELKLKIVAYVEQNKGKVDACDISEEFNLDSAESMRIVDDLIREGRIYHA